METGIQYMEVKQNVELAFLKNHIRKFSGILHSNFFLLNFDKLISKNFENYVKKIPLKKKSHSFKVAQWW